jgi:hypothetical protein
MARKLLVIQRFVELDSEILLKYSFQSMYSIKKGSQRGLVILHMKYLYNTTVKMIFLLNK